MDIKRNLKKKLLTIVAAGALLVPSFIGAVDSIKTVQAEDVNTQYDQSAEIATDTVTVKLHKVEQLYADESHQNTGDIDEYFNGRRQIANVTFTVFDVTSEFEAELRTILGGANPDIHSATDAQRKQAYDKIVEKYKSTTPVGNQWGSQTTNDAEGVATFTNLPQASAKGENKVYVFAETKNDTAYFVGDPSKQPIQIKKSVNTVLALPIIKDNNKDDVWTSSEHDGIIDLYPKNELSSGPIEKRLIPSASDKDKSKDNGGFTLIDDKVVANGPGVAPTQSTTQDSTDPTVSRSVGDLVKFEVKYTFPADLATASNKYTELNLTDLPDKGLSFYKIDKFSVNTNPEISKNDFGNNHASNQGESFSLGGDLSTDIKYLTYTGTEYAGGNAAKMIDANKMTITFKNLQNLDASILQKYAGKTLTIEMYMVVNSEAPIEQNMNNYIEFENKHQDGSKETGNTTSEFVIVYKKGISKVNGQSDKEITESKAGFVLKNSKGQYFAGYNSETKEVQWVTVTGSPVAKDFVSSEGVAGTVVQNTEYGDSVALTPNPTTAKVVVLWTTAGNGTTITGHFNLPGLRDGSYKVVEVQAPEGYYLDQSSANQGLDLKIENEVGKNSYLTSDTATKNGALSKIKNYPRGFLPSTGGIGIIIFIVIGVAAMGIGAFVLVRNRKSNGHIG